jgi:hypothetical protein
MYVHIRALADCGVPSRSVVWEIRIIFFIVILTLKEPGIFYPVVL